MANNLPDYLRMQTDAAPYENQVFICGDVRFTAITPQLIRIEQGGFTDEATLNPQSEQIIKAFSAPAASTLACPLQPFWQ